MLKCLGELSPDQMFVGELLAEHLGGLAPLLKECGMTFTFQMGLIELCLTHFRS